MCFLLLFICSYNLYTRKIVEQNLMLQLLILKTISDIKLDHVGTFIRKFLVFFFNNW